MLYEISHGKLAGKLPTGEPCLVLFKEYGEHVVYQSSSTNVCDKSLWRRAQKSLRSLTGACVCCGRTRRFLSAQTTWCSHPAGRIGIYHCEGCRVIYAKLKLRRTGEKFYWMMEPKKAKPARTRLHTLRTGIGLFQVQAGQVGRFDVPADGIPAFPPPPPHPLFTLQELQALQRAVPPRINTDDIY